MNKLEQYFEMGYIKTEIDGFIQALLWNEIFKYDWVDDTQQNLFKSVPSWYFTDTEEIIENGGQNRPKLERIAGYEIMKKAPKDLKDIGKMIVSSNHFDFFRGIYRDVELEFLDVWNGSEEIDYHYDTINGSDTLVLIYMTEQKTWNHEWGGVLSAKKQFNGQSYYETDVMPLSGNMIIINNSNPLFLHKVTKLKNTSVNRYTFSFNYKWL